MSITRNNGEVTLTFSGVEIKGVLNKGFEMSKYIPKVGEEFQLSNASGSWSGNKKAVFITPLEVIWLDDEGLTQFAIIERAKFRPAPTKADVERKTLIDILNKEDSFKFSRVAAIQNAGFTIPKKVKRIDIENAMPNRLHLLDFDLAVDNVCELLGDLIED